MIAIRLQLNHKKNKIMLTLIISILLSLNIQSTSLNSISQTDASNSIVAVPDVDRMFNESKIEIISVSMILFFYDLIAI